MKFLALVIAVLCLLSSAAWANVSQHQLVGRSVDCIVDRGMGMFDIAVNPEVLTALSFPGKVVAGKRLRYWQRDFTIRDENDLLIIRPHGMRRNATTNMVVTVANPPMKVVLFVFITDDPAEAMRACRFVARDAIEAEEQRLNARLEQKTAEIRAHADAEIERQTDEIREQTEAKTLDWKRMQQRIQARERLFADGELRSSVRAVTGDRGKVDLEIGRGVWIDGEFWTAFWIHNRGWRPYRLAHVQVTTANGSLVPINDIELDSPARPREESIAEVPSGERVAGFMRIPDVAVGSEPKAITFRGFSGREMLRATAEEPVWFYVPKRKEEIEKEQRDKAAQGMLSLHLEGVYGAIWLGDGTGLEQSAATSLKGLGVHMTYALTRMFAVEGEIIGATTGNATFDDILYSGMQGDLARSAILGRMQFGGVLRLGEKTYIPLLRMGVGLQGASHSGALTTATGDAPGPDIGFSFDALWHFGTGVDLRLSKHFVAGIGLSAVVVAKSLAAVGLSGSVEAGIHLGYAWPP